MFSFGCIAEYPELSRSVNARTSEACESHFFKKSREVLLVFKMD
jgi:hypothetical protein